MSTLHLHSLDKELAKSLSPLSLSLIKNFSKQQLMEIILLRETTLYNAIHDFNDGLKKKDRKVFKNQQKEIERLNNFLANNSSETWEELHNLKSQLKASEIKHENYKYVISLKRRKKKK